MHALLFCWPLTPVTAFLTASTSACRATCCACAPALVGLPRNMLCLSLRSCAWPRPRLLRGLHGARRGREEELVQAAEARVLTQVRVKEKLEQEKLKGQEVQFYPFNLFCK